MHKILVVGSSNVDYTTYMNRFPQIGETIQGIEFDCAVGGKGANQACAAALAGGNVMFLSAIGNDAEGKLVASTLKDKNVSCELIRTNDHTGIANIMVNRETGDNSIVVIPGSNYAFSKGKLELYDGYFRECDFILLQLEIPIETVYAAINLGKKYNKSIVLNPAPAKKIDPEMLSKIDFITPNETELSLLTGLSTSNEAECLVAMDKLLNFGVKNVIVTRGKHGSILKNKNNVIQIKACKVKAIDSTAAGDCYNGTFLAYFSNGLDIKSSLEKATIASAIAVTKKGAISSLPTKEEIDNFNDKNYN